jgi:hypothetical protein
MLSAGLTTLKVDMTAKWDDFVAVFPDQKEMLPRTLGSRVADRCNLGVKEAFSLIGYDGPPEALSLYLCFLNSVAEYSTDVLEKLRVAMQKFRKEYKAEHGMNPIFCHVVAEVIRQQA